MPLSNTLPPLLILLIASVLPAAEQTEGDRQGAPRPPSAEKMFQHFDGDHDQTLSRQEFIHGMAELVKRRPPNEAGDGDRRPKGDGEGHPRPPKEGDGERPPKGAGDHPRPPKEGDGHPPKGEGDRPRPSKEGEGQRSPKGDVDDPNKDGGERPRKERPLEGAFAKADADHSGGLSLAEFRVALEHMPHPSGGRPLPREGGEGKPDRPRPPKE